MTTTEPAPPPAKPDVLVTVDRICHRLVFKGVMMGADLYEVSAPGQLMHGTAVMFSPGDTYDQKVAHFTGQFTAAKRRAGETIELCA